MSHYVFALCVLYSAPASCRMPHSFAEGATDSVKVKASADSVAPAGTPLAAAEQLLKAHRFGCVRSDERIPNGPPTLRATYCAGPTVAERPTRYWLVVLLHERDTVVATQARTLARSR